MSCYNITLIESLQGGERVRERGGEGGGGGGGGGGFFG